ncbi:hypothetical protein [Cellulosilyticum sp. WCF-2]|uniref:hypothetical protein n=1 Tax=Cellulosilyticum sp. WCF-2 TaxID=2497860 RepID=UPI000F8D8097|nr:hypothetical protein [Cellulosilyticum sp. WCF-2]QEH69327.1 hypothetical protein EKH84_13360 [Cellulosilyticum sp. WCF-2]
MKQDELILQVAKDLYKLAEHIDSLFNVASKKKTVSIEEVRSVLAEKSQVGKGPEIRALIEKYGADKLTDLEPSCYEALLNEVETL